MNLAAWEILASGLALGGTPKSYNFENRERRARHENKKKESKRKMEKNSRKKNRN